MQGAATGRPSRGRALWRIARRRGPGIEHCRVSAAPEVAYQRWRDDGRWPGDFDYRRTHSLDALCRFSAQRARAAGPDGHHFDRLLVERQGLRDGATLDRLRIDRCGRGRWRRQPVPVDPARIQRPAVAVGRASVGPSTPRATASRSARPPASCCSTARQRRSIWLAAASPATPGTCRRRIREGLGAQAAMRSALQAAKLDRR